MDETKRIFNCFDNPTQSDYVFEWEDELAGINSKRPKEKVKVQDQWQTPACTFYSAYHVINGYNILEDERQGIDRPQIDPINPRNEFCKARWYYDRGYTIQWAATEAKKAGKITGWTTILTSTEKNKQIEQMKKALDMWYFINTGSANWDRAKTKKTGIYTLRKDNKFVWHAWSIVDYDESKKCFIAINSRGLRGKEKWYFYVPYDLVDKIYSKLVIIDKSDNDFFLKIKSKAKAIEIIRNARKLYEISDSKTKSFLEKAWISKFLMDNYWIKETEI